MIESGMVLKFLSNCLGVVKTAPSSQNKGEIHVNELRFNTTMSWQRHCHIWFDVFSLFSSVSLTVNSGSSDTMKL